MTVHAIKHTLKDLGIDPKTYHRDAECATHGAYSELGGSITGRDDRVRWFGCPDCNKALREQEEAEARTRDEQARQARIEGRLRASGIPMAFRGRTFDTYEVHNEKQGHALAIAQAYADDFWHSHLREGGSLVFGGSPGTGKSHLALAIAQQVMRRGTAAYMDAASLVRKVRATWGRDAQVGEETVLQQLGSELDLLVIDEVGSQTGTENEQMILFEVLNRRYADLRPTILLTNLSGEAFKDMLGERTIDRLRERAVFVPFTWDSYRSRR
jgi:DNA replication protein DnaC